jgi:hypothetical protein
MSNPKFLFISSFLLCTFLLASTACKVNVKKNEAGEDKNVDIQTPIGGIHVSEDADLRDTGLPLYPGAKEKPKEENGENKNANVNISGPGFGVRVVAIEYTSNDSPQKIADFYTNALKKYGSVLQCRTSEHVGHIGVTRKAGDENDHTSNELTCDKDDNGKTIELKVGNKDNQHIVAIEPEASGSSFALVYVRTHGKDGMI